MDRSAMTSGLRTRMDASSRWRAAGRGASAVACAPSGDGDPHTASMIGDVTPAGNQPKGLGGGLAAPP